MHVSAMECEKILSVNTAQLVSTIKQCAKGPPCRADAGRGQRHDWFGSDLAYSSLASTPRLYASLQVSASRTVDCQTRAGQGREN